MRSTAQDSLGSGWFADVAVAGGRGYLIAGFDVPAGVEVRVESWRGLDVSMREPLFSERIPPKAGYGYSRIYIWNGAPLIAYHDGVIGHLRNLQGYDPAHPEIGHAPLSPCEGSSPVCFGNGHFAWQGAAWQGYPVSLMDLRTGAVTDNVRPGSPTGLSRIDAEGRVWTIDEDRFNVPGVTNPVSADDLTVAEGPNGGAFWRLKGATPKEDKSGALWAGADSFVPRCAVDGETLAVCTGGGSGVRVFCGSRAELVEVTTPVVVKPQPPVVVKPPVVIPPPVVKPVEPKESPVSNGAGCSNGLMADPRAWFFAHIGRREGEDARDFQDVLRRSGIPAGPTSPGPKPPMNAPMGGLTQSVGDGGVTYRGRIWLPTDTPDENGWYTRQIDVVDDATKTWIWKDWGGVPFSPRLCPDATVPPPSTEEPPAGEQPPGEQPPASTPALVDVLERIYARQGEQGAQLTALQAALVAGLEGVQAEVKKGVKVRFS